MYALGPKSLARLQGVHPHLVEVVKHAIMVSTIDFGVVEGLRTIEQQKIYVAKGLSQTMQSRHLTGHAVDLMPYLDTDGDGDKEFSQHWGDYYPLAAAMHRAALVLHVPLRWGGCWDMRLNDIYDPHEAMEQYVARRKAAGHKAFLDGPHFELPADQYPH